MLRHNSGSWYLNFPNVATNLPSPSCFIITPIVTMMRCGNNGLYNNCTPPHNVEVYMVAWLRCPGLDRLPFHFVKLQRQFPVPIPEIQTITRKFRNQVYSSIPARIRIFRVTWKPTMKICLLENLTVMSTIPLHQQPPTHQRSRIQVSWYSLFFKHWPQNCPSLLKL